MTDATPTTGNRSMNSIEQTVFQNRVELHGLHYFHYDEEAAVFYVTVSTLENPDERSHFAWKEVTLFDWEYPDPIDWPIDVLNVRSQELNVPGRFHFDIRCIESWFTFNALWPVKVDQVPKADVPIKKKPIDTSIMRPPINVGVDQDKKRPVDEEENKDAPDAADAADTKTTPTNATESTDSDSPDKKE